MRAFQPRIENPLAPFQKIRISAFRIGAKIHFRRGDVLPAPTDLVLSEFAKDKTTVPVAEPMFAVWQQSHIRQKTVFRLFRQRREETEGAFLDLPRGKPKRRSLQIVQIDKIEKLFTAVIRLFRVRLVNITTIPFFLALF